MAKVLCVLYEDPIGGVPHRMHATTSRVDHYPDGQTVPSPNAIDFTPGEATRLGNG